MSHNQRRVYIRPFILGLNIVLWPIKAWDLAKNETGEHGSMPTGHLCTIHLAIVAFVTFLLLCLPLWLTISKPSFDFAVSPIHIATFAYTVIYIQVGLSLRRRVDERCREKFPRYDYVRMNLDYFQ